MPGQASHPGGVVSQHKLDSGGRAAVGWGERETERGRGERKMKLKLGG